MKQAIQEILDLAEEFDIESRTNRACRGGAALANHQASIAKNLRRIAKLAKLIWPCK